MLKSCYPWCLVPCYPPPTRLLSSVSPTTHGTEQPDARADYVFEARVQAATLERDGSIGVCQASNETLDDDGSVLLWSKFHKTLPHDALGQVSRGRHPAAPPKIFSSPEDYCV